MNYEINRPPMAVILAADAGAQLRPLTDSNATCMLHVGGTVILERMIRNCLSCGISQFVLVLGPRADEIRQVLNKTFRGIRITYVINTRYRETDTAYALMLAASAVGTAAFVTFDADLVFEVKILRQLVDMELPNVLCVTRDLSLAEGALQVLVDEDMHVIDVARAIDPKLALGRAVGIEKISARTGPLVFAELALMMENPGNLKAPNEAAYARLVDKGTVVDVLDITGLQWTAIKSTEDLGTANRMFQSPITTVSRGQQRALDEDAKKDTHPT